MRKDETTTSCRLCVGICTYQRPDMLRRCLKSVISQQQIPGVEVRIVVVDNEAQRAADVIVADFPAVEYIHEPRRGISAARNAVIAAALRMDADFIAMTDDDAWASPDWLACLIASQRRYGADVIQGKRTFISTYELPLWQDERKPKREGQPLLTAHTCNVLFAKRLIRPDGLNLRFDESLGLVGGEDTVFFRNASDAGAKLVYSEAPHVFEEFHEVRMTYWRALGRWYRIGFTSAMLERRGSLYALWKATGTALAASIKLFLSPLRALKSVVDFKYAAVKSSRNIMGALGTIGFVLGFKPPEIYRKTDGH